MFMVKKLPSLQPSVRSTGESQVFSSKNQNSRSIIITKYMRWILHLNLMIDRFKCYSTCVLSLYWAIIFSFAVLDLWLTSRSYTWL